MELYRRALLSLVDAAEALHVADVSVGPTVGAANRDNAVGTDASGRLAGGAVRDRYFSEVVLCTYFVFSPEVAFVVVSLVVGATDGLVHLWADVRSIALSIVEHTDKGKAIFLVVIADTA